MSAQSGPSGAELGERLAAGDRGLAPRALNLIEGRTGDSRDQVNALLEATGPGTLGREAPGHIVGLTGPPGAGKSTLLSRLIPVWRAAGRTVAVLAVDPSSKRSGGALLGDRARISFDPADDGVLMRSTASGDQLGGLAPATRAAAQVLATAFDVVVVETVGVGQAETDVAELADTVVVVVQPGSGDVLQFLKAGVMEVPDVLVVTKADLGAIALRSARDLEAALAALGSPGVPVLAVSSVPPPSGIEELATALSAHGQDVDLPGRRARARRLMALSEYVREHGEVGLRRLGGRRKAERWLAEQDPRLAAPELSRLLESA